jgi:hypothetical protein
MKVIMVDWINTPNLPEWFISGQDAEVSWDDIQKLFESGINIMLVHSEPSSVLYVDYKRFTQR